MKRKEQQKRDQHADGIAKTTEQAVPCCAGYSLRSTPGECSYQAILLMDLRRHLQQPVATPCQPDHDGHHQSHALRATMSSKSSKTAPLVCYRVSRWLVRKQYLRLFISAGRVRCVGALAGELLDAMARRWVRPCAGELPQRACACDDRCPRRPWKGILREREIGIRLWS